MRKLGILLASLSGWMIIHLGYFAWYHRSLHITFSYVTVWFYVLFALGTFALLTGFHHHMLRVTAIVIHGVALAWSLIDYAYVQVFGNFLPISVSRAGSFNLAMARLLKDYVFLIPGPLFAATGLVLACGIICAFHVGSALRHRRVPIGFFQGSRSTYDQSRGHAGLAVLALLVASLCVAGTVQAADRYRADMNGRADVLGDLGVFGYGVASKRGQSLTESKLGTASIELGDGLSSSRSALQVTSDALIKLQELAPSSAGTASMPRFEKPPHIIIYQMESVAAWPLEQEPSPMPYLEKLLKDQGGVGEYFANGCDTIDAELAINCGYVPDTYGPVSDLYSKNDYRCLPALLGERGYETAVYHANDAKFWSRDALDPAWGYRTMRFSPEIPYRMPDGQVFDLVIDDIKHDTKPSLRYVIGFTSHSPHGQELAEAYEKAYKLGIKSYAEPLGATSLSMESDEATTRMYFGFLTAVDDGLKHLFDRLTEEKLLESTIVVAFGDHRYYQSRATDPMTAFRDYNRLPFFIHVPGMAAGRLAPIASHVDVPSTLYDLVTGSTDGLPPSFLGQSLFAAGRRTIAVNKCLGRASYYDGHRMTEGDLAFGLFKHAADQGYLAQSADSQDAAAASIQASLAEFAAASDLALKRNDLGGMAMPAQHEGEEKLPDGNLADSDHDGISNARERAIGTDPDDTDSDDDGYTDGEEVSNGYDPLGPGKRVRGN